MPRIPEQTNPPNTPKHAKLSEPSLPFSGLAWRHLADQLSPALRWWHERDFVARFQFVIAIDKLHAGADQNTFVVRA
jgi:hypothetical protein